MGVAVASSSPSPWVDARLTDVGLESHFVVLSCRDERLAAKPEPDLYLDACSRLHVEPSRAIAVEDSANGLAAARAAGLACVAVPNSMTLSHDLSSADLVLTSLEATSLEEAIRLLSEQKAAVSSRYDEDREASPAEQLARDAAEVEMGVGRASHDDQVGLAGLRQELELGAYLTAAAREVAADVRQEELLGDIAGEAFVAFGVRDQGDGREESADGRRPGQVGDETGVDAALLALREADGHREGAVARLRTVDPDDDALYVHDPTFAWRAPSASRGAMPASSAGSGAAPPPSWPAAGTRGRGAAVPSGRSTPRPRG